MDEKKLKEDFIPIIPDFGTKLGAEKMRLYALEFEIQGFFADMVLENDTNTIPMLNDLYILEFKDKKINHSALDQLNLYCEYIPKRLYRKGNTTGILVSSEGFSDWEKQECKKQGRLCAIFDGKDFKIIK